MSPPLLTKCHSAGIELFALQNSSMIKIRTKHILCVRQCGRCLGNNSYKVSLASAQRPTYQSTQDFRLTF